MKILPTILAAVLIVSGFTASTVQAQDYKVGNLSVSGIWARVTPPKAKTAASYLMIKNSGAIDDVLIGVKSGVAGKTELHLSKIEGDMMKMIHIGKAAIPAGGMLMLKPGSYHVMYMGLKKPFTDGMKFPLTLVFEKSGELEIMVEAKKGMGSAPMKHTMPMKKKS